ncbi:hypothetical protein F0P96_08825 [Hymenobacter busanensis]|uniref:Uncharacterized protein n=1 Tax=Hymenobacter busanensis TaxID=2607656 RepID=A0A7L4ZXL1_9BACT|nr:hypothetical protein [Hymenobacter busanensis]KAA9333076.1 hypothetical protein F0P96_08825 [Hymenobacter busanensis]QHJ08249.1 hypothetical protein GUY19_13500 [Hymenobacter busanensis]
MQQPNNMRGRQVAQQPSPLAIRTKKYQLDKDTYTKMALTQVWKRDWWQAVIPLVVLSLPAIFWFSWWWIAAAVLVTVLYVLLRSAQVTGVTQMEQSKALFERVSYEMDQRQVLLRLNQEQGMRLTWDMIETVRRDKEAYVLYLKQPDMTGQVAGWRAWAAKVMYVPVFLHLPTRIFNSPNDLRLFESILRRKGFLPAEAGTPAPDAGGKAA